MTAPARPVLRYHGGKWKLAPWIIGHFPAHRTYVEPYGGAASVLLRKSPAHCEVYNDLDERVVGLFRVLRNQAQARELERLLRLTPFARVEFLRAKEPADDPVEQARRTVVMTAMSMGADTLSRGGKSGFRSKDKSNAGPAHVFANFPDHLGAIVDRLRSVVIENMDAALLFQRYDSPETLWYADPPYVPSVRTTRIAGKMAYRHEMTDADHEALAERLHAVEGYVVLSGYDSPLYRRLYAGWPVSRRMTMADKAVPREECLWLSPRTAAKLNRRSTLLEMVG